LFDICSLASLIYYTQDRFCKKKKEKSPKEKFIDNFVFI